jgi:hypothetical protein
MKGHAMNPQITAEEQLTIATHREMDAPERDRLVQCGFTAEEIAALLWLRHWYQTGAVIVWRSCATGNFSSGWS